jgi:uncharacterized protein (TIGR03067 family)
MRKRFAAVLAMLYIFVASQTPADDDAAAKSLQGVWIAETLEADGKAAPAEAFKTMRFTFKGDMLLVRGNHRDNREEECSYKIDPKQSPPQLDFTPSGEDKPIQAIYQVKGDELQVCLRHAEGEGGRPTEFVTKPESRLVLIKFKREKP